ncbi:solute carrier organic anion transporter family member 2A1-like [Ptychodera flava]|uniref:solute carrier organic anion transporter family member 2A1-like n=1 Tax=Ptychodera flava TaxID=63121 RepID=UPI00396A2143
MGVRMRNKSSGDRNGGDSGHGSGTRGDGCGVYACEPACLQVFASPRVFMVLLAVSVCLVACLAMGYLTSVLPTVQKRYHLSASETNWIAASYGVGILLAILFVGYFGHARHRPALIGVGLLICAIGGFLASLPHFVLPSLHQDSAWQTHVNRSIKAEFCHVSEDAAQEDYCSQERVSDSHARSTTTALMSIGLLMCGAGMAPLLSLGTTYIDDGIGSHNTAIYLGVVATSLALGPCLGFVIGAAIVTSTHVEYYALSTHYPLVQPNHPYWVGAWWLGFIIFPSIILGLCVPFFFFPKLFPKPTGRRGRYKFKFQYEGELAPTWKAFPGKLKTLFTNGALMAICIGAGAELAVNTGIMMQIPHYLETQMQASELYASMLTAAVMVPMACLGIFVGGVLVKKLKLTSRKCTRVIMYTDLTTILVYFFLFLFGCNTQFLPNIFYPGTSNSTNDNAQLVDNRTNLVSVNLTTYCNYRCDCDTQTFYPVCGTDDITYFSPCHAGCTVKEPGNFVGPSGQPVKKYSNCSCVANNLQLNEEAMKSVESSVHGGVCENHCSKILPFTIIFFGLACFFSNVPWIPAIMLILRTMAPEDRSISVSIEYMFMHVFGFIITPLILMAVVDSTCFLRHVVCGVSDICMAYDILTYRFAFLTMAAILKFIAFICFMITGSIIHSQHKARRRKATAETAARLNEALDVLDAGDDSPTSAPKVPRKAVDDEDDSGDAEDIDSPRERKFNEYVEQPVHRTGNNTFKPQGENGHIDDQKIPYMDGDPKQKNTRFEVVHVERATEGQEKGVNQIETKAELNHDIQQLTKSPSVTRRAVADHDKESTKALKGPKVSRI